MQLLLEAIVGPTTGDELANSLGLVFLDDDDRFSDELKREVGGLDPDDRTPEKQTVRRYAR
jgi:hypothetical protein